jgi:hypothetical protein
MTTVKKKIVSQPSAPPSSNTDFTSATRDAVLNRVEEDYMVPSKVDYSKLRWRTAQGLVRQLMLNLILPERPF